MQNPSSAFYCHLWPVQLYRIFFSSHYLKNGKIFGKKLLNSKCVFWFSLQILSETFLITIRSERDSTITVCKVRVLLVQFSWNLMCEYFSKLCWESFNFHENWTSRTHTLRTVVVISRWLLVVKRNVSEKNCRENQNTHFEFSNFYRKVVLFMR